MRSHPLVLVSKLPTRQLTNKIVYSASRIISKLPTRQLTFSITLASVSLISKLPTRQLTRKYRLRPNL